MQLLETEQTLTCNTLFLSFLCLYRQSIAHRMIEHDQKIIENQRKCLIKSPQGIKSHRGKLKGLGNS